MTALRTSKVPEVALAFWIIEIPATTLGETGGDAVSMTLDLGYALSTVIFFGVFMIGCILIMRQRAGGHPGEEPARS